MLPAALREWKITNVHPVLPVLTIMYNYKGILRTNI